MHLNHSPNRFCRFDNGTTIITQCMALNIWFIDGYYSWVFCIAIIVLRHSIVIAGWVLRSLGHMVGLVLQRLIRLRQLLLTAELVFSVTIIPRPLPLLCVVVLTCQIWCFDLGLPCPWSLSRFIIVTRGERGCECEKRGLLVIQTLRGNEIIIVWAIWRT